VRSALAVGPDGTVPGGPPRWGAAVLAFQNGIVFQGGPLAGGGNLGGVPEPATLTLLALGAAAALVRRRRRVRD
jgi:hypothetical protein